MVDVKIPQDRIDELYRSAFRIARDGYDKDNARYLWFTLEKYATSSVKLEMEKE